MVEAENDAWPEFVDWQGPERGTWQRYRYTTVSVGREGLPSYKHERTLEPGEGPKGS